MKLTLATSVAAVLLFPPTPALAGGEFYGRIADAASVRSCEGKLIEQIHEGGNIHGFDGMLLLACMQSQTEASWVLLSGTSCNDEAENPTKCAGRLVKAVPRFIVDENFWQAKDTSSTIYPMIYNLLKYGIEEKCKIAEQKYDSRGSYTQSGSDKYWQCNSISTQDGIEDFPKGKWKSFRLTTNSKMPIDVIKMDDASTILGTHFVLQQSIYMLNIEGYLN